MNVVRVEKGGRRRSVGEVEEPFVSLGEWKDWPTMVFVCRKEEVKIWFMGEDCFASLKV